MNEIKINDAGNICVCGDLSFDTVPELNRRGHVFIKQNSGSVFDLDKVVYSDNAGVALLVSWARYGKSIGREISYTNLPKQLLDLIEASGLKNILSIV